MKHVLTVMCADCGALLQKRRDPAHAGAFVYHEATASERREVFRADSIEVTHVHPLHVCPRADQ